MKILDGLPPAHSLTIAQEISLIKRGRRTELVLHTMREAFVYARQCCRASIPDDEIYSLCYTALTDAARVYKPERSTGKFFSYAKVSVRGQISRRWKQFEVVKHSSGHHEDSVMSSQVMRMPEFFSEDDAPNKSDCPLNKSGSVSPEFDLIDIRERYALIEPIIRRRLSEREQKIIELRYRSGFNFPQIGKLFGVSRQAIEVTHGKAIRKIRRAIEQKKL